MKNELDRWAIVVAAGAVVLLIGQQSYRVWRAKTAAAADIVAAQKLVKAAEENDPVPPFQDPKEHSERVLEAWETLPSEVKPLTQWNLYPNPAASTIPSIRPPRRGRGGP